MPRLCKVLIVAIIAAVVAAAQATPAFKWHISKFATITNGMLVVDVPADAPIGMYGATADLDLTPYEGRSLGATVMAEAGPISISDKGIHGLKFMFHFSNPLSGLDCWPEARRPKTPFARQKLEVDDGLSGGNRSPRGTLFLGLQGVTGRIVFDLSTLEIVSGDPFYPQVNGDLVCAYTDRVRNAPQKRGVMLPARPCTEDDFKTLQDWGATLARYQIVDGPTPAKDEVSADFLPRYRAWLDGWLDRLDRDVLPWAVKYGIDIVVDLHVPPGGSKDGEARVFSEKTYTDEFVAVGGAPCQLFGDAERQGVGRHVLVVCVHWAAGPVCRIAHRPSGHRYARVAVAGLETRRFRRAHLDNDLVDESKRLSRQTPESL